MTSLAARMSAGMYRGFRIGLGLLAALAVGVAGSGFALLVRREPNAQWTTLAERGSTARPSPGLAEPLQDVHITLTILFALAAFGFVAWLMGAVIAEWSWPLVLAVVVLGAAAISGYQSGFLAVAIDGSYQRDVQGYGFILDGGFDNVRAQGGDKSALAFRLWVALHIICLPAMTLLLVRGIRGWRANS